jgi:hypothetical protein
VKCPYCKAEIKTESGENEGACRYPQTATSPAVECVPLGVSPQPCEERSRAGAVVEQNIEVLKKKALDKKRRLYILDATEGNYENIT